MAFDARHGVWMVSSIPLQPDLTVPTVLISRSTDGLHWSSPVSIPPPAPGPVNLDKNWTVCDKLAVEPILRQLLHRGRQLRPVRPRTAQHLVGRRCHLGRPDPAFTTQGFMVGDYISTSFSSGLAYPAIASAVAGTPTQDLGEAMFTTSSGLPVASNGTASTTQGAGSGASPLSFVVGPLNR